MNDAPDTGVSPDRRRIAAPTLAVAVLAAVGGLGAALFVVRDGGEAHATGARGARAFFPAEVAVEDGRVKLSQAAGDRGAIDALADALRAAAGGNGVLEFDAERLRIVRDSDDAITGFAGYGDDVPLLQPKPFGDGWNAAFLSSDPLAAELGGRVLVTGVGTAPDGSLEIVQAAVEPVALGSSAATCGPVDAAGGTVTCGPETADGEDDAGTCGIPPDAAGDGSSCADADGPLRARDIVRFRQR